MYAAGSGNGPIAVARRPNEAAMTGHAHFVGRPAARAVGLQQGPMYDAVKQRTYVQNGANYAFRAHEQYSRPDLRRPGEPPQLAVPGDGRLRQPARNQGYLHEAQVEAAPSPDAYQERYAPWPPDQQDGPRIEYAPQSVHAQRVRSGFEQGSVQPSGMPTHVQEFSPHAPHAAVSSHPVDNPRYSIQPSYSAQPGSYVTRDDMIQNRRMDMPSRRDVPETVQFRPEGRPSLQSEEMMRFRNVTTGNRSASPYARQPDVHASSPTSPPNPIPGGSYGPVRMDATSRTHTSYTPPLASGSFGPLGVKAPHSADEASDRFHDYLLDYLERAGFRATAAALQSELLQSAQSAVGGSRSQPARRSSAEDRVAGGRPSAALLSAKTPQAPSPSSSFIRPPSRPVATPSSATTTTHFGFSDDARRGSDLSSWSTPASGTAQLPLMPHAGERVGFGPDGLPNRLSNLDRGFLYEWWSIFWDVYSNQTRAAPPKAGGRSFVRAASGAAGLAEQPPLSDHDRRYYDSPSRDAFVADPRASYQGGHSTAEQSTRPPIPLRRDWEVHATASALARSPSSSLASRMQGPVRGDVGRRSAVGAQADGRDRRAPERMPARGASDSQLDACSPAPSDRPPPDPSRFQADRSTEGPENMQSAENPHTAVDSSAPSFSPGALQYNPEQLQQTATAYQKYRASLVAKQATQLELAKRQLSDLSGGAHPASSVQAVGRPAAVAGVALVRKGSTSMPPPANSSKRTSTTSTPQSRNATLPPKITGGPGSASVEAEASESMLGKRPRAGLNESVLEPERRNRLKADRRGSPDPAIAATAQSAASQRSSTRPGSSGSDHPSTSTPTDIEPDLMNAQTAPHGPKAERRDHLPASAPIDDVSMDQLNALLSATTDSTSTANVPSHQDIAGLDDAAFDYDEFLSSFAGGSANYDPTSRAFDVSGK